MAAAVVSRLIPHPPNFTPVGAVALLGGAAVSDRRLAFGLPLAIMLVSDLALGVLAGDLSITFHHTMPVVYLAFAINVCLGMRLRQRRTVPRLVGVTLAGALQFFILTNFAVWALTPWYAKTWVGLVECYLAALPFFQYQLLGDFAYVTVLFGALALAEWAIPAVRPSVSQVPSSV
jgi:hypothetical protein